MCDSRYIEYALRRSTLNDDGTAKSWLIDTYLMLSENLSKDPIQCTKYSFRSWYSSSENQTVQLTKIRKY